MLKRSFTIGAAVLLAGCGVSTQQEVELGQQEAQQVNAQLPMVQDAVIQNYVNTLGQRIARTTSRSDLNWQFQVVNSNVVNAFALPGGFIYVNRGVLARASNSSEVAGVLAHEIEHVVRRHSVKQMEQAQGANIGLTLACVLTQVCNNQATGALINVGGTALFAKFSRDDEAQADEEGVKNVVRAGIDPRGIPEMFRILINERERSPSTVDAWFATHPLEESRIQATDAQIAKINPAILNGLTKDSQSFQTFKQRVRGLPAAPPATRASR